jgi:hypothetical protein
MTVAERLAEPAIATSMEGTKRLEQAFSRVRRILNIVVNGRFFGKRTRLLNRALDSPGAEPKVIDRERHSPVGGRVISKGGISEERTVLSNCRGRSTWAHHRGSSVCADDFTAGRGPTLSEMGTQVDELGWRWWPAETTSVGRRVLSRLLRDADRHSQSRFGLARCGAVGDRPGASLAGRRRSDPCCRRAAVDRLGHITSGSSDSADGSTTGRGPSRAVNTLSDIGRHVDELGWQRWPVETTGCGQRRIASPVACCRPIGTADSRSPTGRRRVSRRRRDVGRGRVA